MKHTTLSLFLTAAAFVSGTPVVAQDVVDLHRVSIDLNNVVTIVYSKNFATCAHMRFSDATCSQFGALTHVQNHWCASGTQVVSTVPLAMFNSGFGPNIPVFMVHGNNSNVRSACLDVVGDGKYGTGCAGSAGIPVLDTANALPLAGTTIDLDVTNGPASSLAVLGFGLSQTSIPVLGCDLLISPVLATVVVSFDASGAGTFSLPLPVTSVGATVTAQAFALDVGGPQGFSATNGLQITVL
jgi:hypothetical protein